MELNCAILDTRNMELLFKNPRDVKLIFVFIWKKEVKRTNDHCIFFDLGSDKDFLILTLCLILASGASQKNLIIKK